MAEGSSQQVRTAIVTGAAGGVGGALVRTLSDSGGWQVVAIARKQEDVDALNALDRVEAVLLDLLRFDDIQPTISDIVARHPRVDLLANVAAVAPVGSVEESSPEKWQTAVGTNLIGPALLTQYALPAVRATRGSIVFVNSGAGERPIPDHSVYVASKHALRGFAGSLRLEESGNGVRVTTVYPGQINTKMLRGIDESLGVEYHGEDYIQPETVAKVIVSVADATDDVHITNIDLRPRQEVSAKFNV